MWWTRSLSWSRCWKCQSLLPSSSSLFQVSSKKRAPSPLMQTFKKKKRTQYLWDLSLTLTCFDSCSLSLSSPRFEKLQPIIYLLWRFCVSEMFSCPGVTAFHAPTLSFIHVITLPSAKRKEWGEREREACFYFVWVSRLLCAWGDNTSHSHCTGWQHTHTGLTQPQVHTIVFVSILKSK